MEILGFLIALALFFLVPVLSAIFAFITRQRVATLEREVGEHRAEIRSLEAQLLRLRKEMQPQRVEPAAAPRVEPAAPLKIPEPKPQVVPPAAPIAEPPKAAPPPPRPVPPKPAAPVPPLAARPAPDAASRPVLPPRPPVPPPPAVPPPRRPPEPPRPPERPFDMERFVGVKLFSAVGGIAAVIGAIYFLRYSIEAGWLQPPVRVLIGTVTGVALLVVCELKAARKYAVTANALDGAAIAILFSTFFAAYKMWQLIPATIAFGLLALVTAVAALLSIRRESLFIAVLGLLGGFATPILLSANENRPIPLFAYLLLLNIGLSWVAYQRHWPVLTVLTLVFTTIYQWGWVLKFLHESEPSLAMGIFLVFPVVSFAALMLARRSARDEHRDTAVFERTALAAAVLPLLFAVYFAAVPAYGENAALLFGFLLLLDLGLFAIAVFRRQTIVHNVGAVATLLVMAVWMGLSYRFESRYTALGFTVVFVLFFLFAPAIAARFKRPLEDDGRDASLAAPTLLFVVAALAGIEADFASPLRLFGVLLVLLLLCAWRSIATNHGALYYIASFFAIAAQAVWSTRHLAADRLQDAVAIYGIFGLVALGVPLIARRQDRPLEPAAAGGVLLLASLGLLFYLSTGQIAASALWALAVLLAILNAALFIESASGRLPLLSQAGSILSWIILATWWWRAAAAVGLLPSLAFVAGLTLITLGGHAWAQSFSARGKPEEARSPAEAFAGGMYLGLIGHLFLFFVALNREWSLPPWPLFGTLLVITLATSAASLATRIGLLHGAGVTAAAFIVTAWTIVAGEMPWTLTGLVASGAVSALALAWLLVVRRTGDIDIAATTAAIALFVGEAVAIAAANSAERPPFYALLIAHAVNLTIVLTLTWQRKWPLVSIAAAAVAWLAVVEWQLGRDLEIEWRSLLMLAGTLYALFSAYPLVVGRRDASERDPWFAALVAAAMGFFAGRDALTAGGYKWMLGAVPIAQALVTAVLLRALLRLQPAGQRDLGRLALVAGTALAFVTVAIPLQLEHQWITIGWALEGAALAWLYTRVPHRGLLAVSAGLMAAVFARLALNPAVFLYEPRGSLRIFNWYLYTYLLAAAAMFLAAWWLSKTHDRLSDALPRASRVLPAGAVILLFWLLNIEIADYYATGPEIVFRFGRRLSQDLTYTIGWLFFGMLLLAGGISLHKRPARVAAVVLIAVTTLKAFLYDLGSLEGLYRVASFIGLAISLSLVALVLQKYVLAKPPQLADGPEERT